MRLLAILSPTDKWGTKAEYTKFRKFLPRVVRQFSGKTRAADAAEALKLTAQDLFDLGVIERIIRQPKAGDQAMFESLKMLIKRTFEKNLALDDEELLNARYERFRKIGRPE